MEMERWKKDLEYDLNKINHDLSALSHSLEVLFTKKGIVDELCLEIASQGQHEEGFLFNLQHDLELQIAKKQAELKAKVANPDRKQLQLLLAKINEHLALTNE
jgi:hypothetical protein